MSKSKKNALGCLALAVSLNLLPFGVHAHEGMDGSDVNGSANSMYNSPANNASNNAQNVRASYSNGNARSALRDDLNDQSGLRTKDFRARTSNTSNYTSDLGYDNANPNYKNSNVSDQDIYKKIKDKIGAGWFSKGYDTVSYQVNNGAVTLQGYVKTASDKEKVEKEVRNIEGVRSLNSQISVRDADSKERDSRYEDKKFAQDIAATTADEQLNKKIRENVSSGWLWDSYKDVALNTSNGVVTLTGTVDSANDQQKLVNEIQKIDGVKSVRSNLIINK